MPFQSEKQRKYLWANEPEIAREWTDTYGSGIAKALGGRIPFANGSIYKQNILDQYQNIASQYNQPVTYTDSPVFQTGFEKWNPYGVGSYLAKGAQKAKSALGLNTAATAAPFGGGMYVPPKEDAIAEYSKYLSNPEDAKALGAADWATQFGHETSHLGWEYENLAKQLASISPHLKTSASNPRYAGEEQWNYMHDLMYGPRYDENVQGRPGQDYLTTKGLINPGDLSYTPEAFDAIANSGLVSKHKQAIGFGVNPHEDTMMGKMRSYPNAPMAANWSELDDAEAQPLGMFTQDKRNLLQKGLDYTMNTNLGQKMQTGYNVAKDRYVMPAFGIMGMMANQVNPLNPQSRNYNPELQGQVDALNARNMLGDQSSPYKITSGPLAGKNLVSGFGTNDYNAMLAKKLSWFEKRKAQKKSISDKAYKAALAEQRRVDAERSALRDRGAYSSQVQLDPGGGGTWHGQTAAKEAAGQQVAGPGFGKGAYFNQGGLAALWPR